MNKKKFKDYQDLIEYALLSRGIIEGFPLVTEKVIVDLLIKKRCGPIEDVKEFAERYITGERFKPKPKPNWKK